MALKEAYTAKDLAPLLEYANERSVQYRAAREHWQSRPRPGRGGGREWLVASMPEATRLAIRAAEERRAIEEECARNAALPAVAASQPPSPAQQAILDDKRRYKALAKADLLGLYLAWQSKHGSAIKQKQAFILAYQGGAWGKLLAELGPRISWKSLERWKLDHRESGGVLALADKRGLAHKGRTLLTERHQHIILGHVLNPNAPKVSQCVREVQKKFMAEGLFLPSEPTIRRFVRSYTAECFDEWTLFREGKKAWTDKCAISLLRDWNLVEVGDVVIADGHTLNFESIDPDTGKPKRMTIVLFYDGASNSPLGWEIMATENTASISAAFRRTCIMLGKFPRVVYLDNGRAFRAKFFKGCPDFEQAGFLGLYRDLGCSVIHAWPYHGQSKPIERFFGTMHELEVWMPSYTGNDIAHKPARMRRGEELHRKLHEKMGGRPLTLEETHDQVARWFAAYMQRPQYRTHLHGQTPEAAFQAGRGPGLTPQELDRLTLLMMQKEVRTITKDGIRVNGRLYWHEQLYSRRHSVLVRYDEHFDPFKVRVYTLDGNFLCEALDREHHRIASGLHPVARVLGTSEQQAELRSALDLKKSLEKDSATRLRTMVQSVVLPETQARLEALEKKKAEQATQPRIIHFENKYTPEDEAAFAEAREKACAAMNAAPAYTPSDMKRWRDAHERYAYLFKVKFEEGKELVAADAAWMEAHEQTPEFERWKNYYAGLRAVHERQGQTA